ncbi:condensation domain-containing protein, partial [Actinophytocola sp.]|uniref:condensation domain-containing protein n=1 Tax=Actinophytocola sp. TaxID=1872138 RepID=UPI00389B13A9
MTETVDRAAMRAELLRRRLRGAAGVADAIPAVPRTGPLPLSHAQRRMWLLDQLRPGGTEYLMTTALRLSGPLDLAALRRALTEITARHEVLRTRYTLVDGEPAQVIDPPAPPALAEVDLTTPAVSVPAGSVEPRAGGRSLDTLLRERAVVPFDLATEHPTRWVLARLGADEHVLALTVHHIASDGWSEEVLLRELSAGYTGLPLAPLPVQYADFAAWQRSRVPAGQVEYWRERLAGVSPLELPTDRPRPPVRDF